MNLPKTMLAVRLHGVGFENLKVEQVPVPVPNDDQLLARVDAAGVCASNLKILAQGNEHTFINGIDSGSLSRSRNLRLSTTRSCRGRKPGTTEVEPVAMMTLRAPITVPSLNSRLVRSRNEAAPENCLTPLALSSCFTPPVSWPTTRFLCATIAA